MTAPEPRETYLGDGLFATFDGWMITLHCERENGRNWVGLEPHVVEALERFVARLRAEREAAK